MPIQARRFLIKGHISFVLTLCLNCQNEDARQTQRTTPVQVPLTPSPEPQVDFLRPQDLGTLLNASFQDIQRFGFKEEFKTTCSDDWTLHTASLPYDWPEQRNRSRFELYAFRGNIKIVAIELVLPSFIADDDHDFLKSYRDNENPSKAEDARYTAILTIPVRSPYNCYSFDQYLEQECFEVTSSYSRQCPEHLITRIEYFPRPGWNLKPMKDNMLTDDELSLMFNYPAYSNYVREKSPWGQSLIIYSSQDDLVGFAEYMTEDKLPRGLDLRAGTRTGLCRL